nr:ATP-binding cassette domain-containing protein [Streptomyces sp. NBC_00830]
MTVHAVPVADPLTPPDPVLTLAGLGMGFGPGCPACLAGTGPDVGTNRCAVCGTVVALHGVSFEVGSGEVLAVVGESGSGKTTLLRCVNLDTVPDTGRITIAGVGDPHREGVSRRRLQAGTVVMVHQNALAAGLWPDLGAASNVAERSLAAGARHFATVRDDARRLLEAMEVDTARHDDQLRTFSGGMRQRVQLARALMAEPTVLLLDEPTTGLDPSVQAALLDVIQRAVDTVRGATVIVSHDLQVVRLLADRVIVLRHGRVVEAGLTDQVLTDPHHPYTQLLVASQL